MSENEKDTELQLQVVQPTLTNFKSRNHFHLHTTTVYLLHPHKPLSTTTSSAATPWIVAAIDGGDKLQLRHPLTLSHQRWNLLPDDFSIFKLHSTILSILVVSYHTTPSFDKLLVIPNDFDECTFLGLYDGGKLHGCHLELSTLFDDIVVFMGKIYALDREGKFYLVNNCEKTGEFSVSETLIDFSFKEGDFEWRKRLVVDGNQLYLVVRKAEELLEVYEVNFGNEVKWGKVERFVHSQVLFMSRDYCFFWRSKYPGREYKNCIVFSEGAFPRYGDDCWEFSRFSGDGIAVFRLCDGTFAREGENEEFPKFNWSPPPWVLDAWSGLADDSQSHSWSSDCYSLSERESDEDEALNLNSGDEKEGDVQLHLKDSNSKDEKAEEMQSNLIGESKEQERMESDLIGESKELERMESDLIGESKELERMESDLISESKERERMKSDLIGESKERERMKSDLIGESKERERMESDLIGESKEQETMESDLIGESKEQERMESGFDSRDQDGMKYDPDSQEKKDEEMHCNASIDSGASLQDNLSHSTFERFDIRSDLVPILQKIWLKHGNIILHSTIRSDDIIGRALESLATMVQILEDNSAQSLSESQADYLSSTLSDLRCICFKVCWLIPFVEKAVQLHNSKPLLESLNNLRQSLLQVKERRAILFEKLAKLEEEENKLKEEMTMVSKMIPFSEQVKFDEPLGAGLT